LGIKAQNIDGRLQIKDRLTIYNSTSDQVLHLRPNSGNSGYIYWAESGVAERGILGFEKGSKDLVYASGGFDFTNSIERFRIKSNGNVGIGTTNPSAKLDVRGDVKIGGLMVLEKNTGSPNAGAIRFGDHTNWKFHFKRHIGTNAGKELMTIVSGSGNVGIGTTNPSSKLQLMNGNDGISFDSDDNWIGIGFNRSVRNGQIFDTSKSGWQFTARNDRFSLEGYNGASSNLLNILKNGNIGIGTLTTGNHKLAVEGSIGAREIKVEANGWSDFVFEKGYNLPTLIEVENYIKEKGHLKDIPSAKEVEKNGFYLGEMDSKLLQKIEELTLYTINQQKEIEVLKKEKKELKSINLKLTELQKRLEKLENK
jgi:hypothetical protein